MQVTPVNRIYCAWSTSMCDTSDCITGRCLPVLPHQRVIVASTTCAAFTASSAVRSSAAFGLAERGAVELAFAASAIESSTSWPVATAGTAGGHSGSRTIVASWRWLRVSNYFLPLLFYSQYSIS